MTRNTGRAQCAHTADPCNIRCRLMGFQHMHAEPSFLFCRLMHIRRSFRYFWPIIRRPDREPLRRPGWVPLSRPS